MLKGDIDCQFVIVNKTYGTLTQLTTTNGGSYINVEINNSGAVVIVAGVVVTIIAATKRKKQNMNSY